MVFRHSVPILYSSDIRRSIAYYTNVLGFDHQWEWDDVPSFGGVSKDLVELFFCKDGQGHPGTWIAIMVDNVDELHERVKAEGGKILAPPQDRDWGLREMIVEDPDGHCIRIGQGRTSGHKTSSELPQTISIVERLPTVEEFEALVNAVGWKAQTDERTAAVLKAPLHAVVAEVTETKKLVGCVLLLGDSASFYYIKDLMVHPDFQRKHVGTALMQQLNRWIETNAPGDALVGLYTGENLAPFYKQFGFRESFGMCRRIGSRDK